MTLNLVYDKCYFESNFKIFQNNFVSFPYIFVFGQKVNFEGGA